MLTYIFNYLFAALVFIILALLIGKLLDTFSQGFINFLSSLIGARLAEFICNYVMFVGVIFHELSHALLAFLTGAKVTKICLYKLSHRDGRLGCVYYTPRGPVVLRAVQNCLSAMAPAICGIGFTLAALHAYKLGYIDDRYNILFYYIVTSIFFHARLSSVDMKAMLKGLPICYVIIALLFMFLKIDINGLLYLGG